MTGTVTVKADEVWLPVPGWEHYEVSNHGYVRSRNRVLRPIMTGQKRKQYATVRLCHRGRYKDRKVHQLVLESFVGPRPEGAIGCHRDDNQHNNHWTNLYWGTWADNAHDRKAAGRQPWMRLTDEQRDEIRRRRTGGETGKALAAEFGVSAQHICGLFKGRR